MTIPNSLGILLVYKYGIHLTPGLTEVQQRCGEAPIFGWGADEPPQGTFTTEYPPARSRTRP